jgi:hypothetical protein
MYGGRRRAAQQSAESSRAPRGSQQRSEDGQIGVSGRVSEIVALQRIVGNHTIGQLVAASAVYRQADAGPPDANGAPSDANLDAEMTRFVTGFCNQYLLYTAPFAPVTPTNIQIWTTFSGGGDLDEDHFYDPGTGGDQPHVKVRAHRSLGPDMRSPTGDKVWGSVVTWMNDGTETAVQRFHGWLSLQGSTWVVTAGDKPSSDPTSPAPPQNYDNSDQVLV